MSYADGGLQYLSTPTKPSFVPKVYIADGIRRSVADGSTEPGTKFVTEEDYMRMMEASEKVAVAMGVRNYSAGKQDGFWQAVALIFALTLLAGFALMAGGCATPRPTPLPARYVKAAEVPKVIKGQEQAFLWVKFTANREAWPVKIVDAADLAKLSPGTVVMMTKVTDSAGVGQEVRGPRRRNEPTRLIMMVR